MCLVCMLHYRAIIFSVFPPKSSTYFLCPLIRNIPHFGAITLVSDLDK